MNMVISSGVRLSYLRRINLIEPVMRNNTLSCVHIKSLERVAHVAVLIDLPVQHAEVVINHINVFQKSTDLSHVLVLFPVEDVCFRCLGMSVLDEDFFDGILDLFDCWDFT